MTSSSYETPDVYLASFLLCQGAALQAVVRVGARRVLFRFTSDEKLHELLRLYWRRFPMPLVVADLFASFRRLKSLSRRRG